MQAIDIKAELHDDTLILSIYILAERGALPPARLERCWFEFVVLMPVGSGDLFAFLHRWIPYVENYPDRLASPLKCRHLGSYRQIGHKALLLTSSCMIAE